jgi:ABC-2 type transport system permease protein
VRIWQLMGRYLRLLGSLARYTLYREMAFRGNFLVKVSVEVLWLAIMVAFYRTVFARTNTIAGWTEPQYFFFVGCFFAVNGIIEMLFLDNCNEFAELVRTGDLDGLLVKPIDEQFLITCRRIDWGTAPNILMGGAVMGIALYQMAWVFDLLRVATFLVTVVCGTAIAYSFMLLLTSVSVWMVRNQSLMEMWWLFSSVARYPREIFAGRWADLGTFFTYCMPILVVVNVPANAMVRVLDGRTVAVTIAAAGLLLWLSRRFFQYALRSYRSASS